MNLDVVVVTFNSAELLPAALGSLPGDARVIVVDNASADESVEVARSLGVEVVESPINSGFAAGANRGSRLGAADLVLFLNPDARIDVGHVGSHVFPVRDRARPRCALAPTDTARRLGATGSVALPLGRRLLA